MLCFCICVHIIEPGVLLPYDTAMVHMFLSCRFVPPFSYLSTLVRSHLYSPPFLFPFPLLPAPTAQPWRNPLAPTGAASSGMPSAADYGTEKVGWRQHTQLVHGPRAALNGPLQTQWDHVSIASPSPPLSSPPPPPPLPSHPPSPVP